jgi:hypothetical protein
VGEKKLQGDTPDVRRGNWRQIGAENSESLDSKLPGNLRAKAVQEVLQLELIFRGKIRKLNADARFANITDHALSLKRGDGIFDPDVNPRTERSQSSRTYKHAAQANHRNRAIEFWLRTVAVERAPLG